MNLASLFNLAGPDLLVILFIVTVLFGAKKWPELGEGMRKAVDEFREAMRKFLGADDKFDWESRDAGKRAGSKDRFSTVNRVLAVVAVISAMILLSSLSSRP